MDAYVEEYKFKAYYKILKSLAGCTLYSKLHGYFIGIRNFVFGETNFPWMYMLTNINLKQIIKYLNHWLVAPCIVNCMAIL